VKIVRRRFACATWRAACPSVILALGRVAGFERIVITHSFLRFFGGRPQQAPASAKRRAK
jgi:hypothetical protein